MWRRASALRNAAKKKPQELAENAEKTFGSALSAFSPVFSEYLQREGPRAVAERRDVGHAERVHRAEHDVGHRRAVLGLEAAVSAHRLLIFCDENAEVADPVSALSAARSRQLPLSILIGPEGGFADEERSLLAKLPNVVPIALGPRILRADTAAVAALALVQAVLGDWSGAG